MRNHVIPQKQQFNLKMIDKEHKMKTLGGDIVVFDNQRKFTMLLIILQRKIVNDNFNQILIS